MPPAGLRIIAGELRGRRIRTPSGRDVRPTSDKVREAIFNILGQDVTGLVVLDAWAGSGALGFEALSRGARKVTFLESDPRVAFGIETNARELGVEDRVRIVVGRVEESLKRRRIAGPYDLVLADPPYAGADPGAFLLGLVEAGILAEGARVVFERDTRVAQGTGPQGLRLTRSSRYGATAVDFFLWGPDTPA